MIQQIKDQRVIIDGISKAVKELKPFNWIEGIVENDLTNNSHSPIYQVTDSLSTLEGYKLHYLIKTDRGTFRCGSNYSLHTDSMFKSIDRNSKEINKCFDSLILAKGWLGKLLGELGEQTPYANDGKRKDVNDIEPATDVKFQWISYDDWLFQTESIIRTHIEKVDYLREVIQQEIVNIINYPQFGGVSGIDVKSPREASIARTNVYNHLTEAKMWLGFELQRLKENNN